MCFCLVIQPAYGHGMEPQRPSETVKPDAPSDQKPITIHGHQLTPAQWARLVKVRNNPVQEAKP